MEILPTIELLSDNYLYELTECLNSEQGNKIFEINQMEQNVNFQLFQKFHKAEVFPMSSFPSESFTSLKKQLFIVLIGLWTTF